MSEPLPPPADLSYFILKSLESLSKSLSDLQASVTAMQVSLVSRAELKELRDHCDREFKAVQDRCDTEAKETGKAIAALDNSNTELKVKVWLGAALVSAVIAAVLKKLLG